MTYRFCSNCVEWVPSERYTVDETGETVCPDCGEYLSGVIKPHVNRRTTMHFPRGSASEAKRAALTQNIIE